MEGMKPMDIVVDGSIAGLFTGVGLVRLGYNVTVLERSTSSSLLDQGAGINVAAYVSPMIVSLKQLGIPSPIFQFFEEYDRTSKSLCKISDKISAQILTRDGDVKQVISMKGLHLGTTSWKLLHDVLRANFDGMGMEEFIDGLEKICY